MEPAYLGADRSVYPARSALPALADSEVPPELTGWRRKEILEPLMQLPRP
jgi:hypothetical protein